MVFASTTVRVTRFAQNLPISTPPDLGFGPGVGVGGGGIAGPLIGPIGTPVVPPGLPFGPPPFGPALPGGVPVSPTSQILKLSVPRPINPGMEVTMIMWFATAYIPTNYAMRVEIPSISYSHTTPYVGGQGAGVLMLQNTFQLPSDSAPGDLNGQVSLIRVNPQDNQIVVDDQEPFDLIVELTPSQPDGCPAGAVKDTSGLCHCTDPTKEIVGNTCVAKCSAGTHRDSTGHCIPDDITTPPPPTCPPGQHLDPTSHQCTLDIVPCPTGQHKDASGNCVPDVQECGEHQHLDSDGRCVPDTITCPDGQHQESGQCVPDVVTPPPPPGPCPTGQHQDSSGHCIPNHGPYWPGYERGRHRRGCFRHNGIRYCRVRTPPADATNCITIRGMVWCPRPRGDDSHPDGRGCPTGQHFSHCTCNCVPNGAPEPMCFRDCTQCAQGQRFNWCVHQCVPADSKMPDCPPDDDTTIDDHSRDYEHGGTPVVTSTPGEVGVAGGVGAPGVAGTGTGTVLPGNTIQQIENYVASAVNQLQMRGLGPTQIERYANTLRNNIYANVQNQLRAAGITNFNF